MDQGAVSGQQNHGDAVSITGAWRGLRCEPVPRVNVGGWVGRYACPSALGRPVCRTELLSLAPRSNVQAPTPASVHVMKAFGLGVFVLLDTRCQLVDPEDLEHHDDDHDKADHVEHGSPPLTRCGRSTPLQIGCHIPCRSTTVTTELRGPPSFSAPI